MKVFQLLSKRVNVLLCMALLFGVLSHPGLAQDPPVVVDDRGQSIAVPAVVARVVVAGPPLYTEVLVDIGARDLLVGVTDSPGNPPEVADVPRVGPSFPGPNLELIIDLEPDVVFGAVFEVRDQLEAAGITVITPVNFITGIDDLFTLIEAVGLVVGRASEAAAVLGKISLDIVRVESAVVQRAPVRAALLFPTADSPPFASGSGSFENELLNRAGGENVFADAPGFPQVSFEAVIERDPEVIFVDVSQVDAITQNPLLAGVAAVRDGNVVGIDVNSLTSTRVAEVLETLARALHPEAFGQ